MLFNSSPFFIFLFIVFILYWFIPKEENNKRNLLILFSSYFFYGWWDWRFLGLLFLSSFSDYCIGLFMKKQTLGSRPRKMLLWLSIFVNLGILGVFKYFNFFAEELNVLLNNVGFQLSYPTLDVVLPLGISFYTFQSLSYVIDCYRIKIEPEKNLIRFLAYVSFFPQLVAGPIEKATQLLPQFKKEKKFDYELAKDGIYQMIWGFFKKVVIADNCGVLVNMIFNQESYYDTSSFILILGVILFAIQIYGDFSGYSDIAIGTAKLFGFKLMTNFKTPYFSKSTSELWRRWHISLSEYANEYFFLPLSSYFSRLRRKAIVVSLILTFTIIGIWHGANWTYIIFGLWNGVVVTLEFLTTKHRRQLSKKMPRAAYSALGWGITIVVWLIGMTFFRSESMGMATQFFSCVFNNFKVEDSINIFSAEDSSKIVKYIFYFIILMFLIEWMTRSEAYGTKFKRSLFQKFISIVLLIVTFFYGKYDYQEFIYFQF